MKNSKAVIAVLCMIVLIFSLAACAGQKAKMEKVAQVVTDSNGVPVTGVDGAVVTEEVMAQVVTDSNGKAVTEIVTGTNGKPLTTVVDDKYVTVTQVVTTSPNNTTHPVTVTTKAATAPTTTTTTTKKSKTTTKKSKKKTTTKKQGKAAPKAPADVTNLSASSITTTSVKLSWNKVIASGYQIAISSDGGNSWKYLKEEYIGNSYTAKGLVSNTAYVFRVRAYNKNSAGKTTSKWKTVKTKTKADTTLRKIKIIVELPVDGNMKDDLTITVNNKTVKTAKVNLNGNKYTFTTENLYKGEVEITASLKAHGSITVKTDKSECSLAVPLSKIPVLTEDED